MARFLAVGVVQQVAEARQDAARALDTARDAEQRTAAAAWSFTSMWCSSSVAASLAGAGTPGHDEETPALREQ